MTTTLLWLAAAAYLFGGLVTWALADTRWIAARFGARSGIVTLAIANLAVLAGIVSVWPAWWWFAERGRRRRRRE